MILKQSNLRRISVGICMLVLFLGTTSALVPDDIPGSTNREWLIAGSADTANVTIQLPKDGYPYTVRTWCVDEKMGRITDDAVQTVSGGNATAIFTVGTKSGDAVIMWNVTSNSGESAESNTTQQVDHAIPKYYATVEYEPEVPVDTSTSITVHLKDVYGNLVDTRRLQNAYSESITLLASPEGDGGFLENGTYVKKVTRPVNGSYEVIYRVPTRAGQNIIQITAPDTVVGNIRWITVSGIATIPDRIAPTITSSIDENPSAPNNATANGRDVFSIYYTLYDPHDNPVPDKKVTWQLTDSNQVVIATRSLITNYQGQVYLEHGPSTVVQNFTAHISVVENSSIQSSDILSYVPGGPALFVLYANPESMASREVPESGTSTIRARLMDGMGRPISGEKVRFKITSNTPVGSELRTKPSFASDCNETDAEAITDENGYASVIFYPGGFPPISDPAWNPDSYGSAEITAMTETLGNETITITYMNYPYLRAETVLDPPVAAVNDSINVTIRLIGDGFVQYKPIDVMLCNNRGEAMFQDMYWDGNKGRVEDKMVYLYEATQNFTYNLNNGTDSVGLVSFGINGSVNIPHEGNSTYKLPGLDYTALDDVTYTDSHYMHPKTYYDYATVDSNLTKDLNDIRSILNQTVPSKDPAGTVLVPMRYGLYQSIKTLNGSAKAGHVRGIILLTDSEWTAWGDPSAGWDGTQTAWSQGYYPDERNPVNLSQGGLGMWTAFRDLGEKKDPRQDMAHYANENDIHIYTIAYFQGNSIVPPSLGRILQYLAGSTGGKYYIANSAKALDQIYVDIAEDLKKYASVDTSMNLSFETINVTYDNVTKSYPGADVFSYQYEESVSTNVTSWNDTVDTLPEYLPVPPYPSDAIPNPWKVKSQLVIKYPYTLNQTTQWEAGTLKFYAGSIVPGQTWQVQFRLQALTPGVIDLFGPDSKICYTNEGEIDCIPMPGTYPTITYDYTGDPTSPQEINLSPLNYICDENGNLVSLTWRLDYQGDDSIVQEASYSLEDTNNWIGFSTLETEKGPLNQTYSLTLNTEGIGNGVQVRIFAREHITPAGASNETMTSVICSTRPSIMIT
jgi:hypothetical protein